MKALFSLFLLLTSLQLSQAQDRLSGKAFATRSEVLARNGMAATNHPLATQIAIDILKRGGSAVDAAIAANAFLGFADPGNNGIGGDLFAIVWDEKTQQLYGLNASGESPGSLSVDKFKAEIEAGKSRTTGPLSVTTPGAVGGWFALHENLDDWRLAICWSPPSITPGKVFPFLPKYRIIFQPSIWGRTIHPLRQRTLRMKAGFRV